MRRRDPRARSAAWLLFTVLVTGSAPEALKHYAVTYPGMVAGTIGDHLASDNAAGQPMGPPAPVVQRTALAPVPSAQRSENGHSTRPRKEAVLLLILMVQGLGPNLTR